MPPRSSETRGKRRLAKQLLVYNGLVLTVGVWFPEALDIGKFVTPFIFPSAIGLYTADAYFATKHVPPTG